MNPQQIRSQLITVRIVVCLITVLINVSSVLAGQRTQVLKINQPGYPKGLPEEPDKTIAYLFPGQGGDYRIFSRIELPDNYRFVHVPDYPVPDKDMTLRSYAHTFIKYIDTSRAYVFIGLSLGGMICTELTDTLNPKATILISSAKTYRELPGTYTFQRKVPLNRIVPGGLIKAGALAVAPIVEPEWREDSQIFKPMLKAKDPAYLKRTIDMIINWERISYHPDIIHIHGDSDNTIPVTHVDYDYLVRGGSHMMVYTRAEEVNALIRKILEEQTQNPKHNKNENAEPFFSDPGGQHPDHFLTRMQRQRKGI